jgi:hypothetical protein
MQSIYTLRHTFMTGLTCFVPVDPVHIAHNGTICACMSDSISVPETVRLHCIHKAVSNEPDEFDVKSAHRNSDPDRKFHTMTIHDFLYSSDGLKRVDIL